ncbi:formylglycine-generating enzyme family protein [Pseudanabaena sp. FACHB-2040]|uniref:formylglycine-generating enzyme family protein n=1 Tax=Pseudanabaena sp. FACHB-2040 TaxID=2692859 RepID=UPI00168999A6|nr:formylglycine-generating enzyme family protein [Pseudanabaena sp. FACHB-2040]MBD2261106.1 formylglycine-generating enzyme family protein [Pseudanabaena sp. FACHB-2040]
MADLILQREDRQAQYFIEQLGEGVGLDMILVPGGSFLMGSPENEPERSDSEGPQHKVNVPSFFTGRYPVTQAQWRLVAALPQVKQELNPDPSNFKGDLLPVEQVSWYDAAEFCDRLAALVKRPYRLPSEAEWEYACRSGTTTPFHFGKTLTTALANYDGNHTYSGGPEGEYRQKTNSVDYFGIVNAFGLHDMHGNVYEWCQDHWHSNYDGAPTDGSVWISENEDARRVIRGGSWLIFPRNCRSACRLDFNPRGANNYIGFRVVCSASRVL